MSKISKSFLSAILAGLAFLSFVSPALAADTATGINASAPKLSISIGNYTPSSSIDCSLKDSQGNDLCSFPWIGEYIAAMFKYGVGLAAMLAVIMMMIGGFVWLSSGGSPDRVGKAKEFISSALIGLFLALFSYLMLYTINPRLVASESILVPNIKQITTQSKDELTSGCCYPECKEMTKAACSGTDKVFYEITACTEVTPCQSKPGCCVIKASSMADTAEKCVAMANSTNCKSNDSNPGSESKSYKYFPSTDCKDLYSCP